MHETHSTTQTRGRTLVDLKDKNIMPCWEILMFMAIILLYFPDFSVSCITEMEKIQSTNLSALQSTEDEAPIEDISTGVDEL